MSPLNDYLDIENGLDVVVEDNSVRGYYRGTDVSGHPVTVSLLRGGEDVASATCDGSGSFVISVPEEIVLAGKRLVLRVTSGDLGAIEISSVDRDKEAVASIASPLPTTPIIAHLDALLENGLLEGWSWCPESPDYKVSLVVVVDGSSAGSTLADLPRHDLASAGVGDGAHAFSFLLPWSAVQNKSEVKVGVASALDPNTILASRTFHRKLAATIDDRLNSLDKEVRLLRSRLKTVEDQNRHVTRWVGQTLGAMAGFFDQMSRITLESAVTDAFPTALPFFANPSADLEPIALAPSSEPDFTLVVRADGDLEQIHSCLQYIKLSGVADRVDVTVLDRGMFDDVSNIAALASGVRYWRIQSGQSEVEAVNILLQTSRRKFIGIFSSAIQISSFWIDHTITTFDRNPTCVVIAPKLVRIDGTTEVSALTVGLDGRLIGFGQAELEFSRDMDTSKAVVSASSHAIIFRASAFGQVGRLSQSFLSLAPATVDFCIRCWAEGFSVIYQPTIRLDWDDAACPEIVSAGAIEPETLEIFRRTWERTSRAAWPPQVGRALILVGSWEEGAGPAGIVGTVTALLNLRVSVSVLAVDGLLIRAALADELRAAGATVLRPPFCRSAYEELETSKDQYGVIAITSAAAQFVAPTLIRERAPKAQIALEADGIFSEAGLAGQPLTQGELERELAAVDWLITRTRSHYNHLYASANMRKVRQVGRRPTADFAGRQGLFLTPSKYPEVTEQSQAWFGRNILPGLLGRQPDIVCHVIRTGAQSGDVSASPFVAHESGSATAEFLERFRLAVAPMQVDLLDPTYRVACHQADLPVVCPIVPMIGSGNYADVTVITGSEAELVGQLLALYNDEPAWRASVAGIEDETALAPDNVRAWLTDFYSELIAVSNRAGKVADKRSRNVVAPA